MLIGKLLNISTATWRDVENKAREVTFSSPCPYLNENTEGVPIQNIEQIRPRRDLYNREDQRQTRRQIECDGIYQGKL